MLLVICFRKVILENNDHIEKLNFAYSSSLTTFKFKEFPLTQNLNINTSFTKPIKKAITYQ